jgi:dihydroneopterin aldolase
LSTDRIELRGLRVLGRCGVLPLEREQDQPLDIDVDLDCDLSVAGGSDELADTIDYGAVCQQVEAAVRERPANLLEHMAHRVLSAVLDLDNRIEAVTVGVRKVRPPVPQDLATSGVRMARRRGA